MDYMYGGVVVWTTCMVGYWCGLHVWWGSGVDYMYGRVVVWTTCMVG